MPAALTTLIDAWRLNYSYIWADLHNFSNYLGDGKNQCDAESWAGLANTFQNLQATMDNIKGHFKGGTPALYSTAYDTLHWIDVNWPSAGEEYVLTLDKMLTAIWDSGSIQWFHFINYIDSMRAGIWNIEIYETHLAEWYRHFSITG